MSIYGNIDVIQQHYIEGWIYDSSFPNKEYKVQCLVDDKIISEANASIFRQDLLNNNIGNGKHGFKMQIPPIIDKDKELKIVESISRSEINGSPIKLKNHSAFISMDKDPTILIDFADMFLYFECHDNVTGIQRVQINVFKSIINNYMYPLNKIIPVYFNHLENSFYCLKIFDLFNIIEDLERNANDKKYKRNKDGKLHLLGEKIIGEKLYIKSEEKYILLVLGASWVFKNYFSGVRQLKKIGVNVIFLIHDLIPIILPNMCDKGTVDVFSRYLRNVKNTSDIILTISHNTKNDIEKYYKKNKTKLPPIFIIKNGQEIKNIVTNSLVTFSEDYVLFVATIEGRKNHLAAVNVWERLLEENGQNIPKLIFVGRSGWRVEKLIEKLYETKKLNNNIIIFNDVNDEELYSLYKNCLFTIYPSYYEGWGLPVGESLQFGKICLSSNASSLPEVGGEFAVYFDPLDEEDFYKKAKKLIFDIEYRKKIEKNILDNFKPITWAEVTKNIINATKEISDFLPRDVSPILPPGEYSFSHCPQIDSSVQNLLLLDTLFKGELLDTTLTNSNFYLADEVLGEGIWYDSEKWGTWGHISGNSLCFKIMNENKKYILFLKICLPSGFSPATIEISSLGRPIDIFEMKHSEKIIKIDLEQYTIKNKVNLYIKLIHSSQSIVENELRKLGIGFCRMALIEKDNLEQRIQILEKIALCQ